MEKLYSEQCSHLRCREGLAACFSWGKAQTPRRVAAIGRRHPYSLNLSRWRELVNGLGHVSSRGVSGRGWRQSGDFALIRGLELSVVRVLVL